MRLARLAARFDHVRINRALREPLDVLELCRFLVEDFHEHAPDDLALLLRIRLAGEGGQKPLLRIDTNNPHAHVLRERRHHLIALPEPQEPVIYEHAGELWTDGAV